MPWISMIALICVTQAPRANVSELACQSYYKACIERVLAVPGADKTKATPELLATAFYNDPANRTICAQVLK